MITRREFLSGSAALFIGSRYPLGADDPLLVNDIHSQLNGTRVDQILTPKSVSEVQAAVRAAKAMHKPVSIAGGRHAMGGQQFGAGTVLLDMRQMSQVLVLNLEQGKVEVQAGAFWPELIAEYLRQQEGGAHQWGLAQKQTGADKLSVGGTLAANAHGRGLTMRPFVSNVEAFTLVNADGDVITCSRE